jgi:hypothetical protein
VLAILSDLQEEDKMKVCKAPNITYCKSEIRDDFVCVKCKWYKHKPDDDLTVAYMCGFEDGKKVNGWRDARKEKPSRQDSYLVYDSEGSIYLCGYDSMFRRGGVDGKAEIIAWRLLPDPPAFA